MDRVAYALSLSEMKRLNPMTKVITYDELQNIDDIDEILEPYGECIILYLSGSNYGHWVCVYTIEDKEENKSKLAYFCPYGYKIDSDQYTKNLIDDGILFETGQIFNILSELMINSRYDEITYNDDQFQTVANDVSSCGRWCTLRLWLRHIPDVLFKKFCFYFDDREELVTMLTDNVLAKYYIPPLDIIKTL
jgi:hypothetical protein